MRNESLENIVKKFGSTPVLFVGSGMTRRYYGLPDWKSLLMHFAKRIKDDPFVFRMYESKGGEGGFPEIAALIEKDFNEKWYQDESMRDVDSAMMAEISNGNLSPFKAEIAKMISDKSKTIEQRYSEEIQLLSDISEHSIASVITTNYDSFIEDHFKGFTKYVGQNQLIFSPIQGVAEIYKIHGSIENPNSIVINSDDYANFEEKRKYLAAKLMTIFMEYPVIFMGYSISDSNIRCIMESIVDCLDDEQLLKFKERFIFVEYDPEKTEYEIESHAISFGKKQLPMTKIILSDYRPLYSAIGRKRSAMPVWLLRKFKNELYNYVITHSPTSTMRVASIEDERIKNEELVLAIGRADRIGQIGFQSISSEAWYRNVILGDLDSVCSADNLLDLTYPKISKENSGLIPIFKYLSKSKNTHPDCEAKGSEITYEDFISSTLKKRRKKYQGHHSVIDIWKHEKGNLYRATDRISLLTEDEIDVEELYMVLQEIFEENKDVLSTEKQPIPSNIRRLIRIYDYLKWGKNKKSFQ